MLSSHWFRMSTCDPYISDGDGAEVTPVDSEKGKGYRYFGAAKQLPGVKELFDKQAPRTVRRTRHQMNKNIDADYYGFRDEEDGILEREEKKAEQKIIAEALAEWDEKDKTRAADMKAKGKRGAAEMEDEDETTQFIAHVPLPDTKDIEAKVLEKKKRDLLAKYMSSELQDQENEAKEMLNTKK